MNQFDLRSIPRRVLVSNKYTVTFSGSKALFFTEPSKVISRFPDGGHSGGPSIGMIPQHSCTRAAVPLTDPQQI